VATVPSTIVSRRTLSDLLYNAIRLGASHPSVQTYSRSLHAGCDDFVYNLAHDLHEHGTSLTGFGVSKLRASALVCVCPSPPGPELGYR
jgi:hypothetical protein